MGKPGIRKKDLDQMNEIRSYRWKKKNKMV